MTGHFTSYKIRPNHELATQIRPPLSPSPGSGLIRRNALEETRCPKSAHPIC